MKVFIEMKTKEGTKLVNVENILNGWKWTRFWSKVDTEAGDSDGITLFLKESGEVHPEESWTRLNAVLDGCRRGLKTDFEELFYFNEDGTLKGAPHIALQQLIDFCEKQTEKGSGDCDSCPLCKTCKTRPCDWDLWDVKDALGEAENDD